MISMENTDDFLVNDTGGAEKKIRVLSTWVEPLTFWSTIPRSSSKDGLP